MSINTDSIPLMRQLARMANMEMAGICRMVLVLDVRDIPRLFVESLLDRDKQEELVPTELKVEEKPVIVDTSTMMNERYKTKAEIG